MTHVDDWLDDPVNKDHPAREFLEHSRRPAMDKDQAWLKANRLLVTWQGSAYHLVGCSRMGDVWLKDPTDGQPNAFYSHRVDIAELTDYCPLSGGEQHGA